MSAAPFPATPHQQNLLRFIIGYQQAHDGVSPSLRECAKALGGNKSNIHQTMVLLAERGWVRVLPRRARAIEVLHALPIPSIGGVPLWSVPLPDTVLA